MNKRKVKLMNNSSKRLKLAIKNASKHDGKKTKDLVRSIGIIDRRTVSIVNANKSPNPYLPNV